MDWNDYLTVIFGFLATMLTIIQIYQLLPKNVRLSFSELKAIDTSSKASTIRRLAVLFRTKNIGNKDNTFDITAKLLIFFEEHNHIIDRPVKILKEEIKSKESKSVVFHFDIPLSYNTWNNPQVKFTYSYIKGDRIITKHTRWKKGIRGKI